MEKIGLRIYRADEPNEKYCNETLITKIRPLVGESIMIYGQRVKITDISTNTFDFLQDILNLYVEEQRFGKDAG